MCMILTEVEGFNVAVGIDGVDSEGPRVYAEVWTVSEGREYRGCLHDAIYRQALFEVEGRNVLPIPPGAARALDEFSLAYSI